MNRPSEASKLGRLPVLADLVAYADQLERSRTGERRPKQTDPPLRRFGKYAVPQRFRRRLRLAATRTLARRARARAEQLGGTERPLRLHVGSGPVSKPGWVNVDLVGDSVDLAWDLTSALPFPSGRVDAIFHEHFFPVLPLSACLAQLQDCHRLLKPGGVMRIGVPDPWKDRSDLPAAAGVELPRLLVMQEVFYYPDNKSMYDAECLTLLLRSVGFAIVEESAFGESRLDPCPDSEHRREWTVYVEAVK